MCTKRSLAVDGVKLLSAMGVVWAHIEPSTENAARIGEIFHAMRVPMFFVVSLYFVFLKLASHSPRLIGSLKFDTLLVPYLSWSAIYVILRLAKYRIVGESVQWSLPEVVFFGGAAMHLYFIPMLLFMKAGMVAAFLVMKPGRRWWLGVVGGVGVIVFGWCGQQQSLCFHNVFARSGLYALAAWVVWLGQQSNVGRRLGLLVVVATGLYGIRKVWLGGTPGDQGLAEATLFAYAITVLALNCKLEPPLFHKRISWVLSGSYGLYLSHHAFFEGIELAMELAGCSLAPYTVATKSIMIGVVLVFSLGFVWLVRRHSSVLTYCLLGQRLPAKDIPAGGTTRFLGEPAVRSV